MPVPRKHRTLQQIKQESPEAASSTSSINPLPTTYRPLGESEMPSIPRSTFMYQATLPRLPVPSLQQSMKGYLKSIRPLATRPELQRAEQEVDAFIKNDGTKWQQKLEEWNSKAQFSWLDDTWLNLAYLDYRATTMINVNWWTKFKDNDNQPKEGDERLKVKDAKMPFTQWQVRRTAFLLHGILRFEKELKDETIAPNPTRGADGKRAWLDMWQFTRMFQTSRVAEMPSDYVHGVSPTTSDYIILLLQGQIYRVPVKCNKDISTQELEKQIWRTIKLHSAVDRSPEVSVLTALQRDKWAELRKRLDKESLGIIDNSLFAVSLDDYVTIPVIKSHQALDSTVRSIWHGRNGKNRWLDKSLTLVVDQHGRTGVNGEHSPSDAVIPAHLFNTVLTNEPYLTDELVEGSPEHLTSPAHVQFKAEREAIQAAVDSAEKEATAMINQYDVNTVDFFGFGGDALKSVKFSPDATIQMCIQLAHYRLHNTFVSTYESASTRQFQRGRTEVIRTLSEESKALCEDWDCSDNEQKVQLLRTAIKAHNSQSIASTNGQGFDRHLLGLKLVILRNQAPLPALFTNPLFARSSEWRLSTSNVSPSNWHRGGFGPVHDDGYGVNYAISPSDIRCSISNRLGTSTDGVGLQREIMKILGELQDLMKGIPVEPPKE